MKYLVSLVMVISMQTVADTVIYYDDGSTYTLKGNEEIYIQKDSKKLFEATGGLSRSLRITPAKVWSKRDHVDNGDDDYDPCASGLGFGHVYCPPKEQEPEEECDGLTFGGNDC